MEYSKLWSLCRGDFAKGLFMTVAMAVLDLLYQYVVTEHTFSINWKELGLVAAGAGIVYLIKNFGTGAGGKMLTNNLPASKLK